MCKAPGRAASTRTSGLLHEGTDDVVTPSSKEFPATHHRTTVNHNDQRDKMIDITFMLCSSCTPLTLTLCNGHWSACDTPSVSDSVQRNTTLTSTKQGTITTLTYQNLGTTITLPHTVTLLPPTPLVRDGRRNHALASDLLHASRESHRLNPMNNKQRVHIYVTKR